MSESDMRVCVITGASSGLGAQLARDIAAMGECTHLVLCARRRERMEELAASLEKKHEGIVCRVIEADLSSPDGVDRLFEGTGEWARHVRLWINNAGFGLRGEFSRQNPDSIAQMLAVDITALTLCTRRILPFMLKAHSGRILNIASVAGFSPIPGFAVYAAAKSFVLSLTEALAVELNGTGVTATAFCPGPMPTEFFDVAGKTPWHGPSFLWLPVEKASREALSATFRGQPVCIPQSLFLLETFFSRFVPRSFVSIAAGRMFREH